MTAPEPYFPLPPDKWEAVASKLRFSPTQKSVVVLILQNFGDRQIEAALDMPLGTLRTHLKRIYQKAKVYDRQELIVIMCGMSHGICRP